MTRPTRTDLDQIVAAAITAASPDQLVSRRIEYRDGQVLLDGAAWDAPVPPAGRVLVVGGGKAAADVAAAVETVFASPRNESPTIGGLISVPAGHGRSLDRIEVRETRPAGTNLPTAAAVAATRDMLALMASLGPHDLVIAVVTGGGSAILEDPIDGVSLEELVTVTQRLSSAGADIRELNLVRQTLSRVKAGGLARSCRAGRLLALVVSDVTGDPFELIASGPCMPVIPDPGAARAILDLYAAATVAPTVTHRLEQASAAGVVQMDRPSVGGEWTTPSGCRVSHVLLGNNATAVDAAAGATVELGYEVAVRHATPRVESADVVGRRLAREGAELVARARLDGRPRGVIEGGEAVVCLPHDHGRGGRNQQTALAALESLCSGGNAWPTGLVVASLGTDGEDGPTDAAGGIADAAVAHRLTSSGIEIPFAVARCDAYPALEAASGLIRTGPTGTNVADVRIILARP